MSQPITTGIFGALIGSHSRSKVAIGYSGAALLMLIAAATELLLGVKAEGQSLDAISSPLTAADEEKRRRELPLRTKPPVRTLPQSAFWFRYPLRCSRQCRRPNPGDRNMSFHRPGIMIVPLDR